MRTCLTNTTYVVLSFLLCFPSTINAQLNWNYNITGLNHVFMFNTTTISIDESPISNGDYIGAFYTHNGNLVCGGYTQYAGTTFAVIAWADDSTTPDKDGFATNETVQWKVWTAVEEIEVDMVATYSTTLPNQGEFFANGMSEVLTLTGNLTISNTTQTIVLPASWSIFSMFLNPATSNIADVTSPILANLSIIKDGNGMAYWPQYGLNLIGNIQLGKGYQIKMLQSDTLIVEGSMILPETIEISLPTAWSIIGYLLTSPSPMSDMLSPIIENLIIVKNGDGQIFWPLYGVDLIGDMIPGQGYQIKMSAPDTLIYPGEGNNYFFTCGDTIVDYDGNSYNTVLIGNQCWMKENLRTSHYANGIGLTYGNENSAWESNATQGVYCYYNNNSAYANQYGALYTWHTAMNNSPFSDSVPSNVQGICPEGWHLPSSEEWKILEGTVDSQFGYPNAEWDGSGWRGFDAGENLKSETDWNYNGNGTDSSGFSAYPGGRRDYDGSFDHKGSSANFWTTSESGYLDYRINRGLSYNKNTIAIFSSNINGFGYSVRCLKDSVEAETKLPNTVIDSISEIAASSVMAFGHIIENGGAAISVKGFCWNVTGNPILGDSSIALNPGNGTFSAQLTNLFPNTTYYVKAYATNSVGTYYSHQFQFTTLDTLFTCGVQVMDVDGNIYNTILIENQCWMKENLQATHFSDGTIIPEYASNYAWDNLDYYNPAKVYCYYNNNHENGFGALYTWTAAVNGNSGSESNPSDIQGVCPEGWHLPSEAEWQELVDSLGGDGIAGGPLKETGNVNWNTPNTGATNQTGFTALPGGYRSYNGYFYSAANLGTWWTATLGSSSSGRRVRMEYNNDNVTISNGSKYYGMSVRCLRNSIGTQATTPDVRIDSVSNLTYNSAEIYCRVTNHGGSPVMQRGICWSTDSIPTIADSTINIGTGPGQYSYQLIPLAHGTTYYIRAYAQNSVGISYSEPDSFSTVPYPNTVCGYQVTDYDGNVYNTVLIGYQCWMKENLKTTHYADGISIPYVPNEYVWSYQSYSDKAYCYLNNDTSNASTFGALYTWAAVMNGETSNNSVPGTVQGICPTGWRVPSDEEWKILEGEVDSSFYYPHTEWDQTGYRGTDAGHNLKTTTAWTNNGNGSDSYGFSAYPSGTRSNSGSYSSIGETAGWWTCTQAGSNDAYSRELYSTSSQAYRTSPYQDFGKSVRCIRDSLPFVPGAPILSTNNLYNVNNGTAICGGNITSNGGDTVTSRGICWNTTGNPTIADNTTSDGGGTGPYTSTLTGLVSNNIYYIKAYATNILGTGYGQEVELTINNSGYGCASPVVDFDGNEYEALLLGNQCWMAENIKATHYSDGTAIDHVTSDYSWMNLSNYSKAYCYYYNQQYNFDIYGAMYTWAGAMNGASVSSTVPSGVQGICPTGWHVPSDEEWKMLEGFADTYYGYPSPEWDAIGDRGYNAGDRLRSEDYYIYGEGSDVYGFNVLPGGSRSENGSFSSKSYGAFFWTTSEGYSSIYYRKFWASHDDIYRGYTSLKKRGFYVRCVMD